ncbi:RNA polymerase sigma factor [Paenibacillus daejeonensis]|uniref:RNA polymerase sigma factor n=1 Tax=Paenibacillus daejeonensis TaxID=135193 RepID=UPI00037F2237|nr:sigma-70 family RNA polymerase sigma factor [Paenibacillus daejeonensis]
MPESISDEVLIGLIAKRDSTALEQLYDRYERPVYAFVIRMVKDAMAAEEVVQELFVRIWNAAHGLDRDKQGKISTWIFAIARNLAIDWLRKRGRRPIEAHEEDAWERAAESASTEQVVEERMLGEQMKAAIRDLKDEQKQVLELIYYKGYTQQEIASQHDIPLGTVKSRVRLALRQLRKRFEEAGREGAWR